MTLPVFKAGDSVLRGSNGGFDSHTLPPSSFLLGKTQIINVYAALLKLADFSFPLIDCQDFHETAPAATVGGSGATGRGALNGLRDVRTYACLSFSTPVEISIVDGCSYHI